MAYEPYGGGFGDARLAHETPLAIAAHHPSSIAADPLSRTEGAPETIGAFGSQK